MGIMGVLNHSHGGWEHFAQGKQSAHDARIFHKLLHCFNPGYILCGDRAFCTYEIMSMLHKKEVHTLMRLHQARHRKLDWRKGKKSMQTSAFSLGKSRPNSPRTAPWIRRSRTRFPTKWKCA